MVGGICLLQVREFYKHKQVRRKAEQAKKKNHCMSYKRRLTVCSQKPRKLLARVCKPSGDEPSDLYLSSACSSPLVLTLGFSLWPNSAQWKERKEGGERKLSPQNSPAEAPDLTEEDGCVLWTFRLSFK